MADNSASVDLQTLRALQAQDDDYSTFPASSTSLYDRFSLSSCHRSIRVLDLAAASNTSLELIVTIRIISLDTPGPYNSLSYVWGEEDAQTSSHRTISCDGCKIPITENCYQALIHVRAYFGAVSIWVDAICINQADDKEKEEQIPLMGDVYGLAQTVVVWLGPGDEQSDEAMEYLRRRALYGTRIPLSYLTAEEGDKAAEWERYGVKVVQDMHSE